LILKDICRSILDKALRLVKLEKLGQLEEKVERLVEQFSLLKGEKERVTDVLKKKSVEHREAKEKLEKLNRERYIIRSKLDALIDKLENIEHL
jgi:predicted nuclease with TOPRIM domain